MKDLQILSAYAECNLENIFLRVLRPWANEHFSITALSLCYSRMAESEIPRFIFLHNDRQNHRISIRWSIVLRTFSESMFDIKKISKSLTPQTSASLEKRQNVAESASGSV